MKLCFTTWLTIITNGFVSGIEIISVGEATAHRNRLEHAENQVGALHYKSKVHTILTSPLEVQ